MFTFRQYSETYSGKYSNPFKNLVFRKIFEIFLDECIQESNPNTFKSIQERHCPRICTGMPTRNYGNTEIRNYGNTVAAIERTKSVSVQIPDELTGFVDG